MLHLAARQLVKPASPKAGSAPSWAPRLRDVSAGHWVGGESQQRCYSRDEWARLVQLLQSPQPLGEVRTLPDDDPLAVKALLLLPAAGVLLCACHNDSMLDALEHSLDPTAAVDRPAGDGARDAGALAVRPLGALLAYTAAGKAAGARRASATLRAAASALAYCASQQLVLVGSRSGAVLLYAHGADWEALAYRFAVEVSDASPVAAMMLRPMGADVGGGGGGEDGEGGGEEAGEGRRRRRRRFVAAGGGGAGGRRRRGGSRERARVAGALRLRPEAAVRAPRHRARRRASSAPSRASSSPPPRARRRAAHPRRHALRRALGARARGVRRPRRRRARRRAAAAQAAAGSGAGGGGGGRRGGAARSWRPARSAASAAPPPPRRRRRAAAARRRSSSTAAARAPCAHAAA